MKKTIVSLAAICCMALSFLFANNTPSACKPFLEGKAVDSLSLEVLAKWCEGTPLMIQCDDGKQYSLQTFQVSFFTLKPLMNREFGVGEGGIPYKAREAVSKGMVGDALVLKEVVAVGPQGESIKMPVLSFKIK